MKTAILSAAVFGATSLGLLAASGNERAQPTTEGNRGVSVQTTYVNARHSGELADAIRLLEEGRDAFRHDTFGDEAFWGGELRLHEAIAGSDLGGVGPGVSPALALAVGLKVDLQALPRSLVAALRRGAVDLDDPATTLELL